MPSDQKTSTTPLKPKAVNRSTVNRSAVNRSAVNRSAVNRSAASSGLKSILKSEENNTSGGGRVSVSFAKTKDVHFLIKDGDDNEGRRDHTEQLRLTPIKETNDILSHNDNNPDHITTTSIDASIHNDDEEEQDETRFDNTFAIQTDHKLFSSLKQDDLNICNSGSLHNLASYTTAVPLNQRAPTPYRVSGTSSFPDLGPEISSTTTITTTAEEDDDDDNIGERRQKHMRSMMSILGDDGLSNYCNVRPSLYQDIAADVNYDGNSPLWKIPIFDDIAEENSSANDSDQEDCTSSDHSDTSKQSGVYCDTTEVHYNPLLEEEEDNNNVNNNHVEMDDAEDTMVIMENKQEVNNNIIYETDEYQMDEVHDNSIHGSSGSNISRSSNSPGSLGVSEFLPVENSSLPEIDEVDEAMIQASCTEKIILEAQALLASAGRTPVKSSGRTTPQPIEHLDKLSPITAKTVSEGEDNKTASRLKPSTPEFGSSFETSKTQSTFPQQTRKPSRPSIHLDLSFMTAPSPLKTAKEVLPLISSSPPKPNIKNQTLDRWEKHRSYADNIEEKVTRLPAAVKSLLDTLGLEGLSDEMDMAEEQLEATEIFPDGSETFRGWEVSLEDIICSDCKLLGEISTNLSYLTAWELSDGRCQKFAEQLKKGIDGIDFEALLTCIDQWSLEIADSQYGGDTEKALDHIREVFGLRADVAEAQSRVMWKKSFAQQMTLDVIQLTYNNVMGVTDTLKNAEEQVNGKEEVLDSLIKDLTCEQNRVETQAEMVAKWKQTLNYYNNLKAEVQCRYNFLKNQCSLWKDELIKLDHNLNDQDSVLLKFTYKNQALKEIIHTLNQRKLNMLIARNWSVAQIEADPKGIISLIYPVNCDTDLSHFNSPFILINGHHYSINDSDKTPQELNMSIASLRHSVITSALSQLQSNHLRISQLTLPQWTVKFQINPSTSLNFHGIQFGDLSLTNYRDISTFVTENDRAEASTNFATDLWLNILTLYSALGVCLNDILEQISSSGIIRPLEAIGGCLWIWLGHINDIVEEIYQLRTRCDAFKGCFTYLGPPVNDLEGSLKFRVYIWTENKYNHRLEIRMPCLNTTSTMHTLRLQVDLIRALKEGSLFGGCITSEKIGINNMSEIIKKEEFDKELRMITH